MIITKKEFETIADKVIEKTYKEAEEKQKQFNVDTTTETGKQVKKDVYKVLHLLYKGVSVDIFEDKEKAEVTEEKYALTVASNANIAASVEKNPIERGAYILLCVDNSKRVFDEIFGEKGNEWLKKECEWS